MVKQARQVLCPSKMKLRRKLYLFLGYIALYLIKPTTPLRKRPIYYPPEVKHILKACIFPNKINWFFALALMIFQGFTSKIAFQLTKGVCSAPTFKLFCF
jgi:hypothetical protein